MEPFYVGPLAVWSIPAARKKPKARVLMVHGISEHSARHANTITALTEGGYTVVRFDLRGAGRSGGRRQWVQSFDDYVEDVISVFNWICRSESELPLFLLGHSMGGAVATHFAALYGRALHGLVLSAPAYLVGGAISPFVVAAGRALARVAPLFSLPKAADASFISRDAAVVDAFVNDPLCCHNNTFQQGAAVLEALAEMPALCSRILSPLLILHGSGDRIIRLEGSFELLRASGSADRTLHVLPGSYHEAHNDLDRETCFALLLQWLDGHL